MFIECGLDFPLSIPSLTISPTWDVLPSSLHYPNSLVSESAEIFPVPSDHSDLLLNGHMAPTVLILLTFMAAHVASPSAFLSGVIIYFSIVLCHVHLYTLTLIVMIQHFLSSKSMTDAVNEIKRKNNDITIFFFFFLEKPTVEDGKVPKRGVI